MNASNTTAADSETTEPAATILAALPTGSRIEQAALADGGDLLLVPARVPEEHRVFSQLLAWAEQGGSASPPVVLDLYGTLVIWTPRRSAVITAADRLANAATAVSDFAETVAELAVIEQAIADAWADYETDLPQGFAVTTAGPDQLTELSRRYQRAMSLAGRLARLSPRIHQPPLHPPTLASQIGERLRDRCRLADREEFADDQLETILRLYEASSQQASDRLLANREHVLTWVIVLLLAAETVLLLVDLLAAAGG